MNAEAFEWLEDQANWPRRNVNGCWLYNFRDDEPDNYELDSAWRWEPRLCVWPDPDRFENLVKESDSEWFKVLMARALDDGTTEGEARAAA